MWMAKKERLLDMPSRGLFILAIITVTTVSVCWYVVDKRYQTVAYKKQAGGLVFPEFQHQITKIADIEVTRSSGKFVLSRHKGIWSNMGIGGFPAIPTRVEGVILAIAGLKYIAPKTNRSRLYRQLEVEDVTTTAKSTRLTFRDVVGTVLVDIIVGKSKNTLNQQGVYLRLPGDTRAWLAEGSLNVRYDAPDWSDRAVVDFDADSLTALTISKSNGETLSLHREHPQDQELTLNNLAAGAVIAHQHQISYLAGLLQELNLMDAKRAKEYPLKTTLSFEAVAHHKQHLVVTLRADELMQDGSVWVHVDAQLADDSQTSNFARQEVARIQSKFNGWRIRLPRKFTDKLKIQMDDIIKLDTANQ